MINRVVLVGRITKDPELKVTSSNIPVVSFTVAVNRSFTDQSGDRQADFINCVVWRKQAENLAKYIRKGGLLGIEGRIQTRTYEAEQGTRYITEVQCDSIQFLESRGEQSNSSQNFGSASTQNNHTDDAQNEFYETSKNLAAEDDLPF
ncbi:Single-stranded DNA-binding protein [Alteracholeplasma palmae J233]|uniref:Single-stranded DNA-binding protein n=1 Tax=Alteracholeplasma palmae (strain ATCC 49389 / J233) TaxID=1318466 RepID=U4KLQ5_ALTPJ|nr:single-stranded DNA-binding protein [Alteracholeplasma palmae]CCV64833.1 Single-stranded DNA-binding protein [Alteracholeplasma palmae J233]